jgi:hypothetical protein
VKGDKAGLSVNGHQKGGDIAVTHKDLGVFLDQVITDFIKKPQASVPASGTTLAIVYM